MAATSRKQKETTRKVIKFVRKSNELVQAKYKFNVWETRIFTKMLTMVRHSDKDFKNYRIYLHEIIQDFNLENNNAAYERLREGANELMSKIVKVVTQTDEGTMELETPIVVGVERLIKAKDPGTDAKFIDISFHPKMKPFLLSLQTRYTQYDVQNILALPSTYSIRIYELLKQYQKIGHRKFTLHELKEIIGVIVESSVKGKKVISDTYPKYGNFRQRVIEKAKRDLAKHTDIYFTYEPIKRGRAVYAIRFDIFDNREHNPVEPETIDVEAVELFPDEQEHLYRRVAGYVAREKFATWLGKYATETISDAVDYVLGRGESVSNVGGYLYEVLRSGTVIPSPKRKTRATKAKAREQKQQREQEEAKIRQGHEQRYLQEVTATQKLMENALVCERISEEALRRATRYTSKKVKADFIKDRNFRMYAILVAKSLYPDAFEAIQ